MGLFSFTSAVSGTGIASALWNTTWNAIKTLVNGNLDRTNIATTWAEFSVCVHLADLPAVTHPAFGLNFQSPAFAYASIPNIPGVLGNVKYLGCGFGLGNATVTSTARVLGIGTFDLSSQSVMSAAISSTPIAAGLTCGGAVVSPVTIDLGRYGFVIAWETDLIGPSSDPVHAFESGESVDVQLYFAAQIVAASEL